MNVIKELRIKTSLSQASFCEKAGIQLQTYQRIEQNGSSIFNLRVCTLYAISKTLGVTCEDIITSQIREVVTNFEDVSSLTYVTYKQLADVCTKEELKRYYKKYPTSSTLQKSINEINRRLESE